MTCVRTAVQTARWFVALVAGLVGLAATGSDSTNHYILDCSPDCVLPPTKTAIGAPGAVTTDAEGNVYFSSPSIVFRLGADGTLRRVAGNGVPGFAGDGGAAVDALLSFPETYPEAEADSWGLDFYALVGGLAVDRQGNLFIADAYNNRIRRVDAGGLITTVAGGGTGLTDPAMDWRFAWPYGVAVAADGGLYVSSSWGTLSRIASDGEITGIAASNCGRGFAGPGLCVPTQLAIDAEGAVYVADAYCRVRRIAPDGAMATYAGDERPSKYYVFTCGYGGEGTPAASTAFSSLPYAVATDNDGNVYIADTYNHCVRKVDAARIVTTIAGVCGRQGGFSGDGGPAIEAKLQTPRGVAVDSVGNVYIADTYNQRLRKVAPDGVITTVAGNGSVPSP